MLTWFSRKLELPLSAVNKARERNFEIAGYVIDAPFEPLRAPRVVRVGLIQNKIVLPTTDPVLKQVGCICDCPGDLAVQFILFTLSGHLPTLHDNT